MGKRIEDLYQQYLLGQLSREDFEELQQKVAHTTDDELWNLMCEDFSLSSEFAEMSHESQQKSNGGECNRLITNKKQNI